MRKQPASTARPLEAFEICPLIQLGRAAMSSPDRSPDALTHEGMIMLLDIIEERLFPLLEQEEEEPPPPKLRRVKK